MKNVHKPYGPYEKYLKRPLDCLLAITALVIASPVMAVIAVLVRIRLGSPVIFAQPRPGRIDPKTGKERIFRLYKFRTMTNQKDSDGRMLPDALRLTPFGKKLRSTSLDELPELWNIIKGDMSLIGPRPQLVKDMVFMSARQRRRHTVRPGLSGLAQINGRNAASWENRLAADLVYIRKITFLSDAKIMLLTIVRVLFREGITEEGQATSTDYGDYLLHAGKVSKTIYDKKQEAALLFLSKQPEL